MIVAGTSATVYPGGAVSRSTSHQRGGDLIEVNPYPSELTAVSRYTLQGPGGEVLPALVGAGPPRAASYGPGNPASDWARPRPSKLIVRPSP